MSDADSPVIDASKPDALTELLHQLRQNGTLAELLESAARQTTVRPAGLSGDLLYGADELARFLYGDRKFRRKVYNLVETNRLPHFRLGASICGRKSILLKWIAEQEDRI
jgi:hypothetical protein